MAHGKVADEIVNRVQRRVLEGMGLVVLHSGHHSKIFKKLMGTSCSLRWREAGEHERIWVVDPAHPIAEGFGPYFELPEEEMYGELFDIPTPDALVFISWFPGGEVFRSGCCFHRGRGKIFYFRPGHETHRGGHRVASVDERMYGHAIDSPLGSEVHEGEEMLVERVDPAITHQSDDVQRSARALHAITRVDQRLVLEEAPVLDRLGDADQVLLHHAPRAKVQVANFTVPHLTLGKADGTPRGLEQGAWLPLPESAPRWRA
jgi:hypothetical protein